MLHKKLDKGFADITHALGRSAPQLTAREIGTVVNISTDIAIVSGLPGVGSEELLRFPGEVYGIAFNVDENEIGVVLLGNYWHLCAGDEVLRTGRVSMFRWEMPSSGASLIHSARHWMAKPLLKHLNACRLNAQHLLLWTAPPSPCRCKPALWPWMR